MNRIWTAESGLLMGVKNKNYRVRLTVESPSTYNSVWTFRGEELSNLTQISYTEDFPYTASEFVETFYSSAITDVKNTLTSNLALYIQNYISRASDSPFFDTREVDYLELEKLSLSELRAFICSITDTWENTQYGWVPEVLDYVAWREGVTFYCPVISLSSTGYWPKLVTPEALTSENIVISLDREVTFALNITTEEPLIDASKLLVNFTVTEMPEGSIEFQKVDSTTIKIPSGANVSTSIQFNVFDYTYTRNFGKIYNNLTVDVSITDPAGWEKCGELSSPPTSMFPIVTKNEATGNIRILPEVATSTSTTYYDIGATAADSSSASGNGNRIIYLKSAITGITAGHEITIEKDPSDSSGKILNVQIRGGGYRQSSTIEETNFTSKIRSYEVTVSYLTIARSNIVVVINISTHSSTESNYHCILCVFNDGAMSEYFLFNSSDFGVESNFLASSRVSGIVIPLYEDGYYYLKGDFGDNNLWWYQYGFLHAFWKVNFTNSTLTKILESPSSDYYQFDYQKKYSAIYINGHSYFVKAKTNSNNYLCYFDPTTPQIVDAIGIGRDTFSISTLISPYQDFIFGQGITGTTENYSFPLYSFTENKVVDWLSGGSKFKYRYGSTPAMGLGFDDNYAYLFCKYGSLLKVYRLALATFFNKYYTNEPVEPVINYSIE